MSQGRRRKLIRWSGRAAAAFALLLGLLAAPLACTSTIVPPTAPREPVTVYLIDFGRTPSLALPDEDGQLVRYVYGDWRYYALVDTGVFTGLAALFWPTQGTLGRREIPGPAGTDAVRAHLAGAFENLYAFDVERQDAVTLQARLNREFVQHRDTAIFNQLYDLEFVQHPQQYTYFYNSNHAVADWLRELGCEVRGPTFHSSWRLADPAE